MPKPSKIEWMKTKEKKKRQYRRKRNLIARLLENPIFRQRVRDHVHKELKRIKKNEIMELKGEYE